MEKWTKIRKTLYNRLADSLKGRILYKFEVYTTTKIRYWSTTPVFYIYVDRQLFFASTPKYHVKTNEYLHSHLDPNLDYWEQFEEKMHLAAIQIIRETSMLDIGSSIWHLQTYIHDMSFADCISSDDYFFRLLAVLDRRLGKRKIRSMIENIDKEPEWFKKWILLRAGAENIERKKDMNTP